jgi:hypothetical protein
VLTWLASAMRREKPYSATEQISGAKLGKGGRQFLATIFEREARRGSQRPAVRFLSLNSICPAKWSSITIDSGVYMVWVLAEVRPAARAG